MTTHEILYKKGKNMKIEGACQIGKKENWTTGLETLVSLKKHDVRVCMGKADVGFL